MKNLASTDIDAINFQYGYLASSTRELAMTELWYFETQNMLLPSEQWDKHVINFRFDITSALFGDPAFLERSPKELVQLHQAGYFLILLDSVSVKERTSPLVLVSTWEGVERENKVSIQGLEKRYSQAQLVRASRGMEVLADLERRTGRKRIEDDPSSHEIARRARQLKANNRRLTWDIIADHHLGISRSQLFEILRRIPE